MRTVLGAWMLVLLAAGAAVADQQAWVARSDAEVAAAMIPVNGLIRHYCAPCGDTSWKEEVVRSVEIASTSVGNYWEVLVNGDGIDLAYVYVETDGGWRNLAIMLNLEVSDVPKQLPGTNNPMQAMLREVEPATDPCADPLTTAEMLHCASAEWQAADAELNAVYQQLMAELDEPRRSHLQTAQRAWIIYRDACADFEAALFEGGSMAPVLHAAELADRTRQRVDELRSVLEFGE